MNRSYSDVQFIETFEDRFRYLKLDGVVGMYTFGEDRYLNQLLYTSGPWRSRRNDVIIRDNGCDLGIEGFEIHDRIIVHHINPITVDDILNNNSIVFDMDNLICTSHSTHNAIHYGDEELLPRGLIERKPGDTKLW